MGVHWRAIDSVIIVAYFAAMSAMGWYFGRRAKSTEQYFVAGRSYPGWILGVSLFGATISSITFVAYPADAFKTAYLRYLLCIMLPVGVLIASRLFVPFFRRGHVTSVFEYLEGRFGPRTRTYGASVFILAQCIRISLIQYLVALLMHRITGWSVPTCILAGGVVTAYYTVVGGIEAVIWTDFLQSAILTMGGLLILGTIVWKLPGGMGQMFSTAWAEGKFSFSELGAEGSLTPIPWGLSLSHKTVVMLLIVGLFQWLAEYSTNQEVIQKYCASKTAKDARQAMWLCCLFSVPTWGYFMLVGTGLFVFYRVFPDPAAADMLHGARKAEEILPYFITTQLPAGLSGIVVAAVLAAAMSSMSSAMNSISAVAITDVYKRWFARERTERHFVIAAKSVTFASSLVMIGGAYWLFRSESKTLQDLSVELQAIVGGGLLGLYMLGFFTTHGDGRATGVGILFAVIFSAFISLAGLGWLPQGMTDALNAHFDSYYTGVVGNAVMFTVGFFLSRVLPRRERNLRNLTVWTQDATPLD
ncbi:MAG TPA: sodium/solute symporter [Candidatus Hydrogenedentes bacterium]|nr:sodium/solute symporter [Candidatus Hydrogenedentota bacterium]HRT18664.1 sodium/solute symporter [Candidatus Hydrogenedentota bacterium]HRT63684.1 sodium/solute symporter [Candidatus Hydrogenedentota bacterium]